MSESALKAQVSYFAGALHGMILAHMGRGTALDIKEVVPGNIAPEGFEVTLRSGTRIQVRLEVIEKGKDGQ